MQYSYTRFLFGWLGFLLTSALPYGVRGQEYTLSGNVTDAASGEMILGATVYDPASGKGSAANAYGFYSVTLPAGVYFLSVRSVGYQPLVDTIRLTAHTVHHFRLSPAQVQLQEVVVQAETDDPSEERNAAGPGIVKLPMKLLRSLPAIGGETDVLKMVQLLPGVVQGVEGTTSLFVRGGDADQNLVLLDEATVYNTGHLLGFFSVFNAETLKDVTLLKGGFPAQYGGRLSSVLDIRMKEGNNQHFAVDGGVGLLSSRLTVQGPIRKGKSSFMIAGRRTYVDQLALLAGRAVPYYFYDLNAKVNVQLSNKDRLYYSTYLGDDVLDVTSIRRDTVNDEVDRVRFGFQTGNFTNTLRWNRVYGPRLFSNVSLVQTHFRYHVQSQFWDNSLLARSSISDLGLKADYTFYKSPTNQISFGGSVVRHAFRPNLINTGGDISELVGSSRGPLLSTFESGLYAWHDWQHGALRVNYGLRLSMANVTGRVYGGAEPRLALRYQLPGEGALKLGYSRMKQYMHLVSSASFALPTDLWYPVTDSIRPQAADQVSLSYNRGFERLGVSLTAEGYYKAMRNVIEYRPGAQLLLNNNYARELLAGRGSAYGFELLLQRNEGRLTGWVGYTLSWSTRQFDGLNGGKPFFARYDRRHNLSLVGTFELSPRVAFSATWVFLSGARFTPPIGQYAIPNPGLTGVTVLPIYPARNSVQLPPAHRLDVNLIIKRKPTRKWAGEWHLGCYNVYNRAQPFRIDVGMDKQGNYRYEALGLFGLIPSVAYNFRF
jgi:hypothetical protein